MTIPFSNNNEREAFFLISSQPVVGSLDGTSATDKKMLTHADNNKYIAVVNDGYRVVENHEILIPLQNQMVKYFDQSVLEDVQIKDVIGSNYRSSYSEYIFPRINREIGYSNGGKTTFGLRYIMKNTFDGSGSVVLYGGAIDFFCTNGTIVGEYDVTRRRHTRNFSVDGFMKAFDKSMERFNWTMDLYQKYADTKIKKFDEIEKLFETLTGKPDGENNRESKRQSLSDKLVSQYASEAVERGANVFSVMSAMTHYASHTDGFALRGKSDETTLYKRQDRVTSWLNSKVWNDFVESVAA